MDYRKNPYIGSQNRNVKYENIVSSEQTFEALPTSRLQPSMNPLHNNIYRNQTNESENRRRWITNGSTSFSNRPQRISMPPCLNPPPSNISVHPASFSHVGLSRDHRFEQSRPTQPPFPITRHLANCDVIVAPRVSDRSTTWHMTTQSRDLRQADGNLTTTIPTAACPYLRRAFALVPPPPSYVLWSGPAGVTSTPPSPYYYYFGYNRPPPGLPAIHVVADPPSETTHVQGPALPRPTSIINVSVVDSNTTNNTDNGPPVIVSEHPDELLLTFLHRLFDNAPQLSNAEEGATSAMISQSTLEYRYNKIDRPFRRKRRRFLEPQEPADGQRRELSPLRSRSTYVALSPASESCSICLSDYKKNDKVRRLPCFHLYHATCVDRWLKSCKRCPMCRFAIDTAVDERATN